MKNLTIGVLLSVLCVWVMDSHAQTKNGPDCSPCYQVGGEIVLKEIKKQGDLHLMLVTEESFSKPLQGFRKVIFKISQKEIKEKRVAFKFTQIPPGRYGIRCFLDQDKNGKLNRGAFGPSEPWGMSWQRKKPLGWPKFKYIAFDVESDVKDIRIVVE